MVQVPMHGSKYRRIPVQEPFQLAITCIKQTTANESTDKQQQSIESNKQQQSINYAHSFLMGFKEILSTKI
jgi:hypothetical protein